MGKLRGFLIILASIMAPFIFLKPETINFTVFDVLLVIIFILTISSRINFSNKMRWYYLLAIFFLFWSMLSLYNASDITKALTTTVQYIFIMIVLFPTVTKTLEYEFYKKIIYYMSISWSVFSLFNLPLLNNSSFLWGGGAGRFVSFYNEPGELGAVTAFMAPFILYSLINTENKNKLILAIFTGGLIATIGMNIASGSRSGLIALILSLILLLVMRYGISLKLVLLVTLLVFLTVSVANNLGMERNALSRLSTNENVVGRTSDYSISIDLMNEYFLLGTGLGASDAAVKQYGGSNRPHNIILLFLTESGVFGLLSIVAILSLCLFYGFRILWNVLFNKRRANLLVAATFSSGFALLIYHFFNTVGNHRGYWLIWAFGLWMSTQSEHFYVEKPKMVKSKKKRGKKYKIVWSKSNNIHLKTFKL